MPRMEASFCCAASSNWCARLGLASCKGDLFQVILIRRTGDDRYLVKIILWWRRWRLPFHAGGLPWIRSGVLAVPLRPSELNQRNHIADGHERRAGGPA